jgi:hypothetical protein
MKAELFTVRHANKKQLPAGMRDGTKLKMFQYLPGFEFPFVGVDSNGIQHAWRETGRKNGKKNNMYSDLVYQVQDPNEIFLFLAITPSGNAYANANLQKLKDAMRAGPYDVYAISINKKTGKGDAAKQYSHAEK